MEPKSEPRDGQDSLAPVQLDRRAIEEEVASMKRGKGARLLGVAAIVGAFTLGGAWLMRQVDRNRAESEAGAAVAALREAHVDAYLRCVVPGAPAGTLASAERLHSAIETQAERHEKAYARTLASCEPKLAGLVPSIQAAPVGSALEPAVHAVEAAALAVQDGAADLRGYLEDPRRRYDYVEVTAFIDRLARASAEYHAADRGLREQLMR